MAELADLVRKRSNIKSRITKFNNFLDSCQQDNDKKGEIASRLEKIDILWRDYDAIQLMIEDLDHTELQLQERETFESSFHKVVAKARNLSCANSHADVPTQGQTLPNANVNTGNVSYSNSSGKRRLPTIDIPKFTGKWEEWLPFRDTFLTLIHNDTSITDIEKLHYLRWALSGDARELIDSLEISGNNYDIAWNILIKRYENNKIIVQQHVHSLINLSNVHKDSHVSLRQFLNSLQQHTQILKRLKEPVDTWDTILISILVPKLDGASRRFWELERAEEEKLPKTSEFLNFLEKRCTILESINSFQVQVQHSKPFQSNMKQQGSRNGQHAQSSHLVTNELSCPICKNTHRVFECRELHNATPEKRLEIVKKCRLCFNCLKSFHGKGCKFGACKKCNKHHNTLLHLEPRKDLQDERSNNDNQSHNGSRSGNSATACHLVKNDSYSFLSTAVVLVYDKQGNPHECRVLLDSGSQPNLMTRELCEKLRLSGQQLDTRVTGIGQSMTEPLQQAYATIASKFNSYCKKLPFLIMREITGEIPNKPFDINSFQIPQNINLADPEFYKPGRVDLLLGAGVFWELVSIGQIRIGRKQPILQKTVLGWIVTGEMGFQKKHQSVQCNFSRETSLETQLQRFWNLEEVSIKKHLTHEESECESHFSETFSRNEEGRFMVQLPFRENQQNLGDSYNLAKRRLLSMERKFAKDEKLKGQYDDFMKEYLELGHMSRIEDDGATHAGAGRDLGYYLPHHAVFKECGDKIKIRVVFDASAKSDSGKSLNDVLLTGPTIQRDLFDIMTRFRQHTYVISADIVKMYRQVEVVQEHRRFQKILWRFHPTDAIQTYQLNTVTYGEASSAFLAIRSLQQAAIEAKSKYPQTSEIILRDFYVDDLLTGADDLDQVIRLKGELKCILEEAKFSLGKWKANDRHLEEKSKTEESTVNMGEGTKVLGVKWDTLDDSFKYDIRMKTQNGKLTKRMILSCVSQIFDPLGLVSPVMIQAKIVMQGLWKIKAGWDESLPMEAHSKWSEWCEAIHFLNKLSIPRHAICGQPRTIEIHGFCDASEAAYGACIYLLSVDDQGTRHLELLCAKSRVAPLKNVSLPKLELCGALLLAKLHNQVRQSITVPIQNSYFWCDSTITLAWIAAHPSDWHTFVANRVSEIQQLTDKRFWNHVRSEENPADMITRGVAADRLVDCDLWWHGPNFLKEDYEHKIQDKSYLMDLDQAPEHKKREHCLQVSIQNQNDLFERFSSLNRLKRVIAYCLRFVHNAKKRNTIKWSGPLQVQELASSTLILVKITQRDYFGRELESLQRSKAVDRQSKLKSLCPFLDGDGVIRIGGRLQNSALEYNSKHPIIIPGSHPFTKMLVRDQHLKHLHLGAHSLLSVIRAQYWPLSGKSAIKRVLMQCIVCFRAKPKSIEQFMGNLPEARVCPSPPFSNTGIDFAGPFNIKISRNKTAKAYLCVFVCLATKALHLEVVSDLTTPAFINTLKRFIARRGKPHTIFSDNGTNFVGADNFLRSTFQDLTSDNEQIHDFLSGQSIEWRFIPPLSPHMGGLWESAVKSCKTHLKKVYGERILSFEELTTLMAQIEAILNSRPLTPISADPDDLAPLTPGHFLIGRPLTAIPSPDLTDINPNRLNRYQIIEQIKQHFWKRWSTEYLSQLQRRNKWNSCKVDIALGAVVIIRDSNAPPMQWRIGRVVKIYPSPDNLVRIVDVKIANNIYKRSVTKLCVLPMEI